MLCIPPVEHVDGHSGLIKKFIHACQVKQWKAKCGMRRPSLGQNEDDLSRLTAVISPTTASLSSEQTDPDDSDNNGGCGDKSNHKINHNLQLQQHSKNGSSSSSSKNNNNNNNSFSKNCNISSSSNSSSLGTHGEPKLPNVTNSSEWQNCRKRKERQDSTSSISQDRKLIRSNSEEHLPNCKEVIRRVSSHEDFTKAECAAVFVNARIPGCTVTPHFCKIQDFDAGFYRQFHIIVCGLDSIVARRWINGMLISMVEYEEDGSVDETSIIPLVDGGTEGFKGNARVILPGMTACIDCTLDLFPPQVSYPLCTIANTPRLPEHCIEYVKIIQWPKENPFGSDISLDGDEPQHITWVYEKAQERANTFNITGLSYRLVQGVLKNIIPAVASTNAVIAATCATEVFKIASSCCEPLNNYMVFNDSDGIYTYTYEAEKKPDCLACSQVPRPVDVVDPNTMTLQDLIQHLCDSAEFQMKNPGLTANVGGKNKTLYMATVKSIEEATKGNLTQSLAELGLTDGQEIMVADITNPNAILIKLKFQSNEVEMA